MKILVKSTVYPLEYNKNVQIGTYSFVESYNKWIAHIYEQNILNTSNSAMESTLKKAKEFIK